MDRYFKVRSALVLVALMLIAAANAKGQEVKWQLIAGENNEFAAYVPEGYLTGSERPYRLIGKDGSSFALISRRITVARFINGTLLTYDLCEGDTLNVENIEIEGHSDLKPIGGSRTVEQFAIKSFAGKRKNRFVRVQYFNSGRRLYTLTSITITESDLIANAFFENARIQSNKRWLAPNLPPGATSTRLPKLIEVEPERVSDEQPVDIKDVDRPPLFLFVDRNNFAYENRKEVTGGKIEIRVLLSSSGKVTKADVLKSSFLRMNKDAVDRAKSTIFIPAEKDGKLVSVYHVLGNSFEMRF